MGTQSWSEEERRRKMSFNAILREAKEDISNTIVSTDKIMVEEPFKNTLGLHVNRSIAKVNAMQHLMEAQFWLN